MSCSTCSSAVNSVNSLCSLYSLEFTVQLHVYLTSSRVRYPWNFHAWLSTRFCIVETFYIYHGKKRNTRKKIHRFRSITLNFFVSLHCSNFSTSLWIDWRAVSLLFVWNFRFGGAFQDVPLFHTLWKDFGHHHIRESLKEFICVLSLSIKLSFSLAIMSCKDFVVVHHRNVLVLFVLFVSWDTLLPHYQYLCFTYMLYLFSYYIFFITRQYEWSEKNPIALFLRLVPWEKNPITLFLPLTPWNQW